MSLYFKSLRFNVAQEGQEVLNSSGDLEKVKAIADRSSPHHSGVWYCATHRKVLMSDQTLVAHLFDSLMGGGGDDTAKDKSCLIAWYCAFHGLEVP